MITAITGARVFDGTDVLEPSTVVLEGAVVRDVGGARPADATVVEARGATLLPGLIDAHVHTGVDGLRDALQFGVTTELEMQGYWTADQRAQIAARDDVADVRSAGWGLTTPGGHPSELFPGDDDGPPPGLAPDDGHAHVRPPTVSSPAEAAELVASLVAGGSDYIKIMIEEGSVLGAPGLPMLSSDTITTAVREARRHGKLASPTR